jgi:hypothetical protein
MKKLSKSLALLGASASYLISTSSAFAQTTGSKIVNQKNFVGSNVKVQDVTQLITQWIFYLAIFLAVVYLMFGGIRWITSRGDKQGVEAARKHIISAVIGLVVVLGTFFILNIVFTILGTENPLNKGFEPPTLKNINR